MPKEKDACFRVTSSAVAICLSQTSFFISFEYAQGYTWTTLGSLTSCTDA